MHGQSPHTVGQPRSPSLPEGSEGEMRTVVRLLRRSTVEADTSRVNCEEVLVQHLSATEVSASVVGEACALGKNICEEVPRGGCTPE